MKKLYIECDHELTQQELLIMQNSFFNLIEAVKRTGDVDGTNKTD